MTIALGIIATDGIVIATDTQVAQEDYLKRSDSKLLASGRSENNINTASIAITGSGTDGYLESFKRETVNAFNSAERISLNGIDQDLRKRLKSFFKDHIMPFAAYDHRERPEVWFLVGAQCDGALRMWATEKNVVRECSGFDAVGAGAMYANVLMGKLMLDQTGPLDVVGASLLASYVVFQVKEWIDGCGKDTHVLILNSNTVHVIGLDEMGSIERIFRQYVEVEARAVNAMLGLMPKQPDILAEATREMATLKARIDLTLGDPIRQLVQKYSTDDQSPQPPSPESPGESDES